MGRPTAYDYTFSLHDALPILPFIVSGIRLAVDSAILLMDEPFAALDAQTREVMQAELLRIWNAAKKTVLFVTHQIDEAVYLSDRVVVMAARPGRVIADIEIDLPRPRPLSVKRTPEFARYEEEIWSLIAGEYEQARAAPDAAS